MSPPGLLRWLPVVVYCGESIFRYEYIREYNATIENFYTLVCGPQDVLLGTKKSWTVFWVQNFFKKSKKVHLRKVAHKKLQQFLSKSQKVHF